MTGGLPPPCLRRFAGAAALAAVALMLLLPGLGRYGLWEPWELRLADEAAALAGAGAASSAGPALRAGNQTWLPAVGIRLFGFSEGGSRLPGALLALATLAAVGWAAAGLYGRRAAWIAALALLAMPLYLLQARQLTSDMPLLLGTALALGGLGRLPSRPAAGAAVAAVGLVLAGLGGGLLVGVAVPCLALAAAWHLSGRTIDDRRGRAVAIGLSLLGVAVVLAAAVVPYRAGQPSWMLGGAPVLGPSPRSFEAVLRVLGFGLFPWGALALLATLAPLPALPEADAPPEDRRRSFAALLPLFVACFGLAASTAQLFLVGQARISVLPAVALALGRLLGEREGRAANRMFAFLGAAGTLLVMRDLWLAPEELASVHLPAKISWPPGLGLRPLVATVGLLFALAVLARFAIEPMTGTAGGWRRWLQRARTASTPVLVAAGLALSVGLAHVVVPALSRHLSHKVLLDAFRSLGGRALALYRVPAENRGPFDEREGVMLTEVGTAEELVARFREDPTLFALVPRAELAALDDAFAGAGADYAVADASSSRFLLLAARLPPGRADQNPLAGQRLRGRAVASSSWSPPRLQASATYADAVELLGADFPPSVRRPGSFPLVLYFRTLRRPPSGYKIFVHVEQPGALVRGDHPPLDGIFPTERWRPGDLLRDQHRVEVPLMTTPSGLYTIFVGFWPGGDNARRLPVTAGEHDGRNRVALGTIRIN